MSFAIKVKAALDLGLVNLARVAAYQLGVRTGLNPVKRLVGSCVRAPFFRANSSVRNTVTEFEPVNLQPFGWMTSLDINEVDWFSSVLNQMRFSNNQVAWYELADFDSSVGDIKGIWEASRFAWVVDFAKAYVAGSDIALNQLNNELARWCNDNQPYLGPNWKCGQEASIRVMHIAMAAKLLGQVADPQPALITFIKNHLDRIAPTIMYAIAQDNNHGTSEAVALYIGGSWLHSVGEKKGKKWQKIGAKWLDERASKLIADDGTFSQYSTNYHRVMLDSYSLAEIWRRELGLTTFNSRTYLKLAAATKWLYSMASPQTGDAPNLGHNDGAHILNLAGVDYRDFRPSVQLASALFLDASAYEGAGKYDHALYLLDIEKPAKCLPTLASSHFGDGGFIELIADGAFVLFNYPKFKFRPAQNDALHVDFWFEGENLLRDGGTFSYNAGEDYINYYGGVASHNTIQFDGCQQMPRLSRFLLGEWLKPKEVAFDALKNTAKAGYTDFRGRTHFRELTLQKGELKVIDSVSGFKNKAVLRWRLTPGVWKVEGHSITNGKQRLSVACSKTIERFELVEGYESRYYYHESAIPVLEIEVTQACKLTTEYKYK